MANFFGLEIKRKTDENKIKSVVTPESEDGATVSTFGAGYYGYSLDLDGVVKNEDDLIRRYRETSYYSDCDSAIEDIINECIPGDEDEEPVTINLESLKISAGTKTKIEEEFKNILHLLGFYIKGHDIFRRWYIDGRLFYHIVLDDSKKSEGIKKLILVDPRKIRKIKNIKKEKGPNGVEVVTNIEEYYVYNEKGISDSKSGLKLNLDSVAYVTSGYQDENTGMVLSYLHKAIKPVNQLKMIEDAFVVYTISRAPQRRIFYIDVGNMPKQKADQYVNEIMGKYRNKIVYDASTGQIRDEKKHMSVLEDFWMPRREGGKGTEITTLQGGDSLISHESLTYFQQKLFQALNVPISRLQPNQSFSLGKSSEITRDEIKFNKFIVKLRKKFATLFFDLIRVQLILKGIIAPEEWDEIKTLIKFDYRKDNFFTEFKDSEILTNRINLLTMIDPYVGKYYSPQWVRKNVLMQTEQEMADVDKEIEQAFKDNPNMFNVAADGTNANNNPQGNQ